MRFGELNEAIKAADRTFTIKSLGKDQSLERPPAADVRGLEIKNGVALDVIIFNIRQNIGKLFAQHLGILNLGSFERLSPEGIRAKLNQELPETLVIEYIKTVRRDAEFTISKKELWSVYEDALGDELEKRGIEKDKTKFNQEEETKRLVQEKADYIPPKSKRAKSIAPSKTNNSLPPPPSRPIANVTQPTAPQVTEGVVEDEQDKPKELCSWTVKEKHGDVHSRIGEILKYQNRERYREFQAREKALDIEAVFKRAGLKIHKD